MHQLTIQQTFDLALQHQNAGRLQRAEQLYRQVLVREPEHIDALHNLGAIAHRVGRNDVAVNLLRRAVALRPDLPGTHVTLGLALKDHGQIDEAIAAYREAISLKPGLPEAHNNLGIALSAKEQFDEAIVAYQHAIALRADYGEAYCNLGNAMKDQERFGEAIAAYRAAIARRPGLAEAHYNLGIALMNQRQLDDAIIAYQNAIARKPNFPEAYGNLGNALRDKGLIDQAIEVYRRAIALQPEFAQAHTNLAFALLLRGDFRQGWEEYEWRWEWKEFPLTSSKFVQPQWDGSDPGNRTILLHPEQGLGDTIQFIRYATLVSERGGKVIFCCHPELWRLLQGFPGIEKCVRPGEMFPRFDFHCPLLSLPRAFQTTLESIPAKVPYLCLDPKLVELWQNRLAACSRGFKVGLVWAGSPRKQNDRHRSMKLADLVPLMQLPGARFFSLQKGAAAAQVRTLPEGTELADWTTELTDFADTAALIANLDLVISVDTAVAHLAGAMGKAVWTLLPFAPDWRWLLNRDDSPWYPTMRLFRQPSAGDWAAVIARVVDAMRHHLG